MAVRSKDLLNKKRPVSSGGRSSKSLVPTIQQSTKELNEVLKLKCVDKNSKYTAIINDWEKMLVDKWLKRAGMVIADNVVKLILGPKHDFVVGVKGQRNLPQDFNAVTKPMASIHCKYFKKGELHHRHGNAVDLSNFMRKYL